MKIAIVLEGKCRQTQTLLWIQEYQKRLSVQIPLELIEWGSSSKSREERFFKALRGADKLVALDADGLRFNSITLAAHLNKLIDTYRTLYLFIGEAEGHSETVLKNVTEKWSLSPLTMSYEIALIVLAEQLYRSMTIITGHPYHK